MEPQTTECSASAWPHRHTDEMSGPLDIKISFRNQPPIARTWPKKKTAIVCLDQPDERTNLTLIRLILGQSILKAWTRLAGDWHNINQCRTYRSGELKFYIKSRITHKMEHPIPRGKWTGTCEYTDHWCMFTFQAMTMKVKPTDEPRIVLPDGTLPAKKKIKLVIP